MNTLYNIKSQYFYVYICSNSYGYSTVNFSLLLLFQLRTKFVVDKRRILEYAFYLQGKRVLLELSLMLMYRLYMDQSLHFQEVGKENQDHSK